MPFCAFLSEDLEACLVLNGLLTVLVVERWEWEDGVGAMEGARGAGAPGLRRIGIEAATITVFWCEFEVPVGGGGFE